MVFTLIELIVVVAILVACFADSGSQINGVYYHNCAGSVPADTSKVMEMYSAYQIKGEPVPIADLLKNKDDAYFISTPKCVRRKVQRC